ncbi:MAG: hypothetical protein EBU26_09580 [Verrucomicrobia bacterium]|jgi:DNA polymerase-3 subunit delta'|nr:hypothetical protein [Verrucomicrobiota bacterium]
MGFKELIPALPPLRLLQQSIRSDRVGHAYLFSGSDRSSLELAALAMSKAINCLPASSQSASSSGGDFCDACQQCHRISKHQHGDVQWIRPESKSRIITIDQVRTMMSTLHLKPNDARYKVWVIVDADRMHSQAANAFLKTLEEPPGATLLLLLTTHRDRLLDTIRSRCLNLHFSGESLDRLAKEHQEWLHPLIEKLASQPNGILEKYQALDILSSRLASIRHTIEQNMKERFLSPLPKDAEASLKKKREEEMKAAIEAEYRRSRSEHLSAMQWWLRDRWLKSIDQNASRLAFPSMNLSDEATGHSHSHPAMLANMKILEDLQRALQTNVQEALALEVHLLKLQL